MTNDIKVKMSFQESLVAYIINNCFHLGRFKWLQAAVLMTLTQTGT